MSGITRSDILAIRNRSGYDGIGIAVETGTFEAATTKLLRDVFDLVFTIELEPDRWRMALERFWQEGIFFLLGDSAKIVPLIAKAYSGVSLLWFLDAHWFDINGHVNDFKLPVAKDNPCPLWAELDGVLSHNQKDIVIVDDVHAFGRKDDNPGGWWAITKEGLDEYLGKRLQSSAIVKDVYVAYLA